MEPCTPRLRLPLPVRPVAPNPGARRNSCGCRRRCVRALPRGPSGWLPRCVRTRRVRGRARCRLVDNRAGDFAKLVAELDEWVDSVEPERDLLQVPAGSQAAADRQALLGTPAAGRSELLAFTPGLNLLIARSFLQATARCLISRTPPPRATSFVVVRSRHPRTHGGSSIRKARRKIAWLDKRRTRCTDGVSDGSSCSTTPRCWRRLTPTFAAESRSSRAHQSSHRADLPQRLSSAISSMRTEQWGGQGE